MPLQIQTTANLKINPSILLYGPAKSQKSRQALTAPRPMIANSDGSGLSSLRKANIPFCQIENFKEIREFYTYCKSPEWKAAYDTIIIDDLTELAQMIRREEMAKGTDGRQIFGKVEVEITNLVRDFRVLEDYFVVFICKEKKLQDDMGRFYTGPDIPGKAVSPQLPYLTSEVWHMESYQDPTTKKSSPVFRTCRTDEIEAGSRAGVFAETEFANLTDMFKKMVS